MSNEMKIRILRVVEKAVSKMDRKEDKQIPIGCSFIFHQLVRPRKKRPDKG
jgi:hypothetical protein